jgi:membrane protease YdiL (CAAX protease family)
MKFKSLLALLLLIPTPSIGAASAMIWFPDSLLGTGIYAFCKIWLFCFPLLWLLLIDRQKASWSPVQKGGWLTGWISGLGVSFIIFLCFILLGNSLIDFTGFRQKMLTVGLAVPWKYILGSLYWILINSVLEEYVWRWFVVKQSEQLLSPVMAILLSAFAFTIHHIVAMQVYFDWQTVTLCSFGIFIGGTIWSTMYLKYRSVWPGYLSHAIIDLCIFGIGACIIW